MLLKEKALFADLRQSGAEMPTVAEPRAASSDPPSLRSRLAKIG